MANPLRTLLDRCSTGFTATEKFAYTLIGVILVVSPLDLIPDVFLLVGQIDDIMVIVTLVKIWRSPTLPSGGMTQGYSEARATDRNSDRRDSLARRGPGGAS